MPRPYASDLRRGLPTLLPLLILASSSSASPYPKDDLHDVGAGFLMPRGCVQYCGYNNMYCCGNDQQCYTSNGIAGCKNTAAGGGYNLYTTTWTLTETFTSTYSSLFPAATVQAPASCVPEPGSGQIACGSICCANWQYCAFEGQCSANAGGGGLGGSTKTGAAATATPTMTTYLTTYTSEGQVVTTPYSAPFRVTSGATATGTALGASTTSGVDVSGSSTSHSLSSGAIAGIVIGVLAGVALLILLCACVLVRGLWHTVIGFFGFGRRKHQDEVIIEEERYRRHSGNSSAWYGRRPNRPVQEKHHEHKGLWALGALGTILALLGLRRHDKNKKQQRPRPRSDISSSYFSGSRSYTSSGFTGSRESRRSRGTRVSRRTDATRISHASRPSRARHGSRSSRS